MPKELTRNIYVNKEGSNGNKIHYDELRKIVDETAANTQISDLHTHLFPPQFQDLNLWGIDALLNYHYLISELFRFSQIPPNEFWKLGKSAQSDLIWQTLFVENTPLSEATRGVICVLTALGLNTQAKNLSEAREFFAAQQPEDYLNNILKISKVKELVMTNDPLDKTEFQFWQNKVQFDSRFHAAIRLDRFLNTWNEAVSEIREQGYQVDKTFDSQTIKEMRRFLDDWIAKMHPLYLAASLSDDFDYPEETPRGKLMREVVLPACKEHHLPLALMIGVRRKVNPSLRMAGDGMGRADVSAVSRICAENPEVRFLATFLSRENQHELCVVARKFSNLLPFGCWWFLNNPSIISEITRERLELLGTSFIPQHSDARVLDQLVYKWKHSRRLIADALFEAYQSLWDDGRAVTKQDIEHDAEKLFSGNFRKYVGLETTFAAGLTKLN